VEWQDYDHEGGFSGDHYDGYDDHYGRELCDRYTDFYNSKIKVFYFYQKNFDEKGNPIDLKIISRIRTYGDEDSSRDHNDYPDPILYESKSAYSSMNTCAVDFVLDSNLGEQHPS